MLNINTHISKLVSDLKGKEVTTSNVESVKSLLLSELTDNFSAYLFGSITTESTFNSELDDALATLTKYRVFSDDNSDVLQAVINSVKIAALDGIQNPDCYFSAIKSEVDLTRNFDFGCNLDRLKKAGMFSSNELTEAFYYLISVAFEEGKDFRKEMSWKDSRTIILKNIYSDVISEYKKKLM